jgi:hypothetical protein
VWEFDFGDINHEAFQTNRSIHDVHRADMVRWHLMHEYGGVWSDMDVIYIDTLEKIPLPENLDYTTVLYPLFSQHTIGHLIASPQTTLYKRIYERALTTWRPDSYQGIGSDAINYVTGVTNSGWEVPDIVDHMAKEWPDLVGVNLPYNTFYPFPPGGEVWHLYNHSSAIETQQINDSTVAIHWFGGHPLTKNKLNLTLDSLQEDTIFNYYVRSYAELLK